MRKIKQNVRPERVLPLDNRHIGATRVKAFREHGQIKSDTRFIYYISCKTLKLYIVISRLCSAKQFRRISLDIFCPFNHQYKIRYKLRKRKKIVLLKFHKEKDFGNGMPSSCMPIISCLSHKLIWIFLRDF